MERRIANFKACTSTRDFDKLLNDLAFNNCKSFWLNHCVKWRPDVEQSNTDAVTDAALAMFKSAARLAIYLQGMRFEYEWEQVNRPQGPAVSSKDDEIIGTSGADPAKETEYELGLVVFGGLVRGDKASGLLANARIRLLKNQIVIKKRGH